MYFQLWPWAFQDAEFSVHFEIANRDDGSRAIRVLLAVPPEILPCAHAIRNVRYSMPWDTIRMNNHASHHSHDHNILGGNLIEVRFVIEGGGCGMIRWVVGKPVFAESVQAIMLPIIVSSQPCPDYTPPCY